MKAIASTVIGIVMADVVTGLIDPKEQHQQEHQLDHFTRDGMNKDITNILPIFYQTRTRIFYSSVLFE